MRRPNLTAMVVILAAWARAVPAAAQTADLIVLADRVWTGDETARWAQGVAVRGDRILAVGDSSVVMSHRTSRTRVIRRPGGFVTPGFIDNHTHFNSAGALLLGVNLLDVSDPEGLRARVVEARDRLPEGAWILGGDWGAYDAWARGATGRETPEGHAAFDPDRSVIDPVTPSRPALLWKWDRSAYLANGAALAAAGATCAWDGVECIAGGTTGRVAEPAVARIRAVIPPRSLDQKVAEGRIAMARLRSLGVTTIHDITPPGQFRVVRSPLARRCS